MKLPEYQNAKENVELGVSTPLEKFIFEFEPMDNRDAKIWRDMLEEAVGYVETHGGPETVSCDCEGQEELPLLDNEQE